MKVDPVDGEDIINGIGAVSDRGVSRDAQIGLAFCGGFEYQWVLLLNGLFWQNRGLTYSES